MTGIELVAKERERQISEEGWTPEHDDCHKDDDLARAGAVYALPPKYRYYAQAWPWNKECYKLVPHDRIRELVKAGALIVAEIDRRLRKQTEATK